MLVAFGTSCTVPSPQMWTRPISLTSRRKNRYWTIYSIKVSLMGRQEFAKSRCPEKFQVLFKLKLKGIYPGLNLLICARAQQLLGWSPESGDPDLFGPSAFICKLLVVASSVTISAFKQDRIKTHILIPHIFYRGFKFLNRRYGI